MITELQQDKLWNTNIYGLDGSGSTNNPLIVIFFILVCLMLYLQYSSEVDGQCMHKMHVFGILHQKKIKVLLLVNAVSLLIAIAMLL